MSVPKSKQTVGHLATLTKARELKKYTLGICTNENNFPKRYRWCITSDIVKETTEICRLIVQANAVKVECEADKERRITRQKMAYELTEALLEDIDTAYAFFRISNDRIEYWTSEVVELQKLLKGWMRTDAERY